MAKTLREKKINQIIYISLGSAIAIIILFIILFNAFTNNKGNEELQIGEENSIEQANSSIGKKASELKDYEEIEEDNEIQVKTDSDAENIENNNIAEATLNNIPETNVTDNSDIESFSDEDINPTNSEPVEEIVKDPEFKMPVEGEIYKHFGKDKLVYSETLKEWTTHLGIDIKADKTTIVKSVADGVVKSIKNDPRYGLTIVVEHENGFNSVYANLLTAEFVVVGEKVSCGQTLGTVGNSATFEILDDTHLHFELLKDGNAVDPEMYLK